MRRMLPLLTKLPTVMLALVVMAPNAIAQNAINPGPASYSHQDTASSSRNDGDETPYAGRNLAYDYVTGEYYTYTGPEPKDRRAGEQDGYRTGVLHTQRAAYHPSSRYDHSGCGCTAYVNSRKDQVYHPLDERRTPY